jgi:NAD(P)-dependent dehydrogenase (short-subunit alcohol dehydrogenase family)
MSRTFANKVAIVTGGASGIGRATAVAFAREGAAVVIADVSIKEGEEAVNAIRKAMGEAVFLKCDVSRADDVSALVEATIKAYGRLDFACNNAGIEGRQASTVAIAEEEWDRTLNVNLKGIWQCMRYELPHMLKQGKGAIVNMASIAGLVGFPALPAYTASKHGVIGLTKAAALENATSGIRINAICPGLIDTPMVDRFTRGTPEMASRLLNSQPIGRIGKPEEIAEAVLWLCSDQASLVTGIALPVDGGWVAQ